MLVPDWGMAEPLSPRIHASVVSRRMREARQNRELTEPKAGRVTPESHRLVAEGADVRLAAIARRRGT